MLQSFGPGVIVNNKLRRRSGYEVLILLTDGREFRITVTAA